MDDNAPGSSSCDVRLRQVTEDDLACFFDQQQDADANRMAAFTSRDPSDREMFITHWKSLLRDKSVTARTILCDERVAGNVVSFTWSLETEVGYWLGREYWGRGVATRALASFLEDVTLRPLHARAARDNIASIRVLQKCGFAIVGEDKEYSNARGEEVEQVVLRLAGREVHGA